MRNYSVTIEEASRELTPRERLKFKAMEDMVKLNDMEGQIISPVAWATLLVHNEYSKDKEYYKYVVEGMDGTMYVTGSASFMEALLEIADEMMGEVFDIKLISRASKNYPDRPFITCTIV